ncbi:hypothetical protein [Paucilactobacillus nenjiangensis]|uniref:hypothetical protein n=1 Tax=Paucilactobacillus nenjiangensis TaxID=1296540 RepID=UPI0028D4FF23|nr:hypothetical protein [Paucilactobacillus nenjiangensis]
MVQVLNISWIMKIKTFLSSKITGINLYFFSFTIFVVASYLQTTMYMEVISPHFFNYLQYVAITLLLFKLLFFQKYQINEMIISLIMLFVSLFVLLESTSFLPIYLSLYIIASADIDMFKIVKWYFWIAIIVLIFAFISSQFGIIKNLEYVRNGITRNSFGIIYPTDFAAHIFYICLAYCFLYFDKLNFAKYLVFTAVAIAVYVFCDARLDMISILLIIPVMIITKIINNKNKIDLFSWCISFILAYLTIASTFLYQFNFNFLFSLDKVLSQRLSISSEGIEKHGIHLFGSHVVEHGWGGSGGLLASQGDKPSFHYFILDSSFVRLFIIYGLLFAVLLIGLITIASYTQTIQGNLVIVAIFLLIAISSVVDQHMIELAYNPFYLGIFCYLFKFKTKESEI